MALPRSQVGSQEAGCPGRQGGEVLPGKSADQTLQALVEVQWQGQLWSLPPEAPGWSGGDGGGEVDTENGAPSEYLVCL